MKHNCLGIGFAAVLSIAAAGSAAGGEIVYSTNQPERHFDPSIVMKNFTESVDAATNGDQKVMVNPGGVLASAAVALKSIGDGVVDAGNVIFSYTPAQVPAIALLSELPGKIPQVSAAAVTETLLLDCPECKSNMDDNGVVILTNDTTEPFTFMCAKEPVGTLADVKGKKIRSVGGLGRIVAEIGATPVNIAFPEVYEALQRGQIDCTVFGAASLATLQIWDVAKYVTTDLSLGTFNGYGVMVVNQSVWEDFTPEQKRIWLDNSAGIVADNARYGLAAAHDALAKSTSEKGVEAVPASADLKDAVDAAIGKITEVAVASAKERGVKDPDAITTAYFKNVEKWTAIFDEIGSDGDWTDEQWGQYRARLKTEIYDKVSVE